MKRFLILYLTILFSVFTETKKTQYSEVDKKEQEYSEQSNEEDRKKDTKSPDKNVKNESETESRSIKWFSLNPGVTIDSVAVDVSGRAGSAVMTQDGIGRTSGRLCFSLSHRKSVI